MAGFVLARILQAIPVLLAVRFLAFLLFAFVGYPVAIMLGRDATLAQRIALHRALGPDGPFDMPFVPDLGRIVEVGPAGEVFSAPRDPCTRMLLEAIRDLAMTGRSRTPVAGEMLLACRPVAEGRRAA
ncbi:MAG TPA: hypothetical protein VMF62_11815 [Acetobacteraceae bacterium]|nr:hypothetical protein [Acetobacteraceae bacterium]